MHWQIFEGMYSLNLWEPLMRGMMVTFSNEGRVWVQFKYESLPNYCFYYGKLGHVSRVCKIHGMRDMHGMRVGDEPWRQGGSFPYEGLKTQMDLWGNVIRSPSRRFSVRSMESRRDGGGNREGMQGDMRLQDKGSRGGHGYRRTENNSGGIWGIRHYIL